MYYTTYSPPFWLRNSLVLTVHTSRWGSRVWENTTKNSEPSYEEKIFVGAQGVPIFGQVAIPQNPRGTIIGTYGIIGELDNQWFLRLLARKAYAQGYAVVLFDWRAHGKTADLSPTLTSDGLYEGEDYVRIAAAAKSMGCPEKFWFLGYSLGGQLALWAVKASLELTSELGLLDSDIGGAAVICPNLDSRRSLCYLVQQPLGRYLEKAIAQNLKKLAWRIHDAHPGTLEPEAIERANSIWGFDHELVIGRLGFPSVEAYYEASKALHLLPHIKKPTLIIYAEDDPLFDPTIVPDLQAACASNPTIDLLLTRHGGHVSHMSSKQCQHQAQDPDIWWAWTRVLQWLEEKERII